MKVLDNADGKQARKTKNSTPLGLLMDHGADCINTGISSMAYVQIVNADQNWIYITFMALYLVFFTVTLEEYYFGSLDFPIINAVNEGTTSTFGILLIGVIFGNEVYQTELFWDLKLYQVIFIGLFVLIVIQSIFIVVKLMINYRVKDVLLKLTLFGLIIISFIACVTLTQNDVVHKRSKIILYIYTILTSRVIISIMISHIFESNFNQCVAFPILLSLIMITLSLIEFFFLKGKLINPQT